MARIKAGTRRALLTGKSLIYHECMQILFSIRRSICLVLALLALSSAQLCAGAVPKWIATVPESTLASTSSTLASLNVGPGGVSLAVISHTSTMDVGGVPIPITVGSQVILIDGRGKIIASGDVLGAFQVVPLLISAKRVVALVGIDLAEFKVSEGGAFTRTSVPYAQAGEFPALPLPATPNNAYFHTSTMANSKVATIRRYVISRLKP